MKCACWQKFGLWMAVLGSLLCCGQGRSQRAIQQPDKYTLIEAETVAQGTVITDKVASGGKYVHREGDYQPLILASVPSRHGDSLTVWVRYRGVGVQLKGVDPDGKQRELPWLYDRPRKFTWASFGTFTRSQLGSKILLICAPGGNGNSGVDAVVFAGEKDDEYNISWTWETRDPRMTDNKGAVYDALVLAASVRNGVDGTTAWNDKDGIYGKTDGDDHLRLPAHSFSLFNTYGIGDCVEATSEDAQTIVAYAVKSPKRYALWIINRSDSSHAVTVACADWKPLLMTANRYEIAASGFSTKPQTWANRTDQHLTVPAFSVTLYTLNRQ